MSTQPVFSSPVLVTPPSAQVVQAGTHRTMESGAAIHITEVNSYGAAVAADVAISINGQQFEAPDLREAAALFTAMADALDAS